MRISIIVAMGKNGVIGLDGGMPWHISADLKHFKAVTMGKPIIMGRKTCESIGRALPGRTNIVITRQTDYETQGVEVANSMDAALAIAGEAAGDAGGESEEAMIIGGAEIYRAALPGADRIYLTEVAGDPEGDVYFPRFERGEWEETEREEFPAVGDAPAYSFVVLERK
ncbi:MAG: dihydrofolate reductase [Proteobacteria bacterium]|nr:dihydrofolate reductase [Pseudomonadota bacterium]